METIRRRMTAWAREIQTPQNRLHTIQLRLQTLQMQHPTLQSLEEENMLLAAYNKAEEDLTEYWRQRSRLQWQTEGDKNTAFFHMVATNRRRINLINYVTTETGALVTDEAGIRQAFVSFFKGLYMQPQQQPNQTESEQYFQELSGPTFKSIPYEVHAALAEPPSLEEIKEILFRMGPDKAAGPDGITARLLQRYWHIFQEDVTQAIRETFTTARPPQEWLKSQIILIPKKEEPQTPKDYRPITVGNIMYRLLMKLIATRLQPYMMDIISKCQSAFLKGRNIADNTILIKEVLHSFQMSSFGAKAFLLKADINKAFDTVNWNFLRGAMKAVNMPSRLVTLICNCMEMSRVTVLVNGGGDGFIKPTRGLR